MVESNQLFYFLLKRTNLFKNRYCMYFGNYTADPVLIFFGLNGNDLNRYFFGIICLIILYY
jgi:hypothetical protein